MFRSRRRSSEPPPVSYSRIRGQLESGTCDSAGNLPIVYQIIAKSVFENPFDFTHLTLNFSSDFLGCSAVCQIWVPNGAARFLFDSSLCLSGPSLCSITSA